MRERALELVRRGEALRELALGLFLEAVALGERRADALRILAGARQALVVRRDLGRQLLETALARIQLALGGGAGCKSRLPVKLLGTRLQLGCAGLGLPLALLELAQARSERGLTLAVLLGRAGGCGFLARRELAFALRSGAGSRFLLLGCRLLACRQLALARLHLPQALVQVLRARLRLRLLAPGQLRLARIERRAALVEVALRGRVVRLERGQRLLALGKRPLARVDVADPAVL